MCPQLLSATVTQEAEVDQTARRAQFYELRTWEFNALLIESILLGAACMAAVAVAGVKLLGPLLPLPDFLWVALGFLLPGIELYPILNVQLRNTRGREVPFFRAVFWSLVGAAVGGVVYVVLF
jgi:hypothetical protein